jgi:4-amino-4-deoxy-L-arabinose transferase-like glycosyltransferase
LICCASFSDGEEKRVVGKDYVASAAASGKKYRSLSMVALVGTLAILTIAILVLSWVPPVSRDALTHHLAVPKIYLENGRMVEIPEIPFSYYPMNLDLLYLIPLYFGNDILPKWIHFGFGLLTAGLVFTYLKKRLGSAWGLVGALIFLSTPVIVKLSITVYVDLGLTFFSFAALLLLFRWREKNFSRTDLVLSATFCGLAMGTKYNGMVGFFILTLTVLYLYTRQTDVSIKAPRIAATNAALYVVIALLVFSPWMVRNLLWTGNPVYPLYNKLFAASPAAAEVSEEEGAAGGQKGSGEWNHLAIRRLLYKESWGQLALIPLRIFYQGRDDDPRYFDGKLNPLYLVLLLCAFWGVPAGNRALANERRVLFWFAAFFIAIAFLMTSIRIRYIAPVIPPVVVLCVFGLHNLYGRMRRCDSGLLHRLSKPTLALAVAAVLAINGNYLLDQFRLVAPFDYISGRVGRADYITRYRPEYPTCEYANQHLRPDTKLLALFMGNRRYYCDRRMVTGENLLQRDLSAAASAGGLKEVLRSRGFTHVIVRYDLFNHWGIQFGDAEKKQLVRLFTEDMRLLFQSGGYGLYVINT